MSVFTLYWAGAQYLTERKIALSEIRRAFDRTTPRQKSAPAGASGGPFQAQWGGRAPILSEVVGNGPPRSASSEV